MGGRPTADAVSGESNHWLPILYRVVLILGYRLLAISFEPKARMIACVSDMPAAIKWQRASLLLSVDCRDDDVGRPIGVGRLVCF